jgi:hypothetical protein
MSGMVTSIAGRPIRQPSDFAISRYNITKSGRTASGNMVMDLVAKKRKFFFTYEVLQGKDLEVILSAIDSDAMFFTLDYVENNVSKSAVVYVGEINYKRFRTFDNGWYWKDVTFNLIER